MQQRDSEPPQLWLHHKVPQNMIVPDEPLVRTLIERELEELGVCLKTLVPALKRVREVVGVGVVEAGRVQDSAYHAQVRLVVLVLQGIDFQVSTLSN